MENLMVSSRTELEGLKRPQLLELVKGFKAEDTDCLAEVNGRSKNEELVTALAEYMGLNDTEVEATEVTEEVKKEITEQVQAEEIQPQETTGDSEVDSVLAELGLDTVDSVSVDDINLFSDNNLAELEQQAQDEDNRMGDILDNFQQDTQAEEKPKKKRAGAIPMDAPIPVREYRGKILGIYGNILEPLEEKDENGFEYYEVKLERYNAKAHETFRTTKGNLILLYTRGGGTYLIAHESTEGEFEPILEVTNKGRGHLRCKQLANALLLAYDEKKDLKIIEDTLYGELAGKIELQEIKWEGLGA